MFDWKWSFVIEILPRLIAATGNTLLASISGYVVAMVVGLIFLLLQRTHYRLLTFIIREIVEFLRSTPLLLQIFFIFYVGPQFGLNLSPWAAGMIAIGLHYSAYLSEVYRGGLEAVPAGQWEAAKALNLSLGKTYRRIILPQALPLSLSGMGNYLIGIFKDTPMLSVIGVAELMHTANAIGSESYRFLEPFTLVGLIYLIISLPASLLIKTTENAVYKKMGLEKS